MRLAPCFVALALCALSASSPGARPAGGEASLAAIREDRALGRIDVETSLLESFRLVFAPDRVAGSSAPEEQTSFRGVRALRARGESSDPMPRAGRDRVPGGQAPSLVRRGAGNRGLPAAGRRP